MSRRTWQLKMLVLAAEELEVGAALFEGEPQADRAPSWDRLVSFALQFGGKAVPEPTREEFDAVRRLAVEPAFLSGAHGGDEDLPGHPTCGRCGVPRDVHDDKAAGHRWQWDRPGPSPRREAAKHLDWLRRYGPATASGLAAGTGLGLDRVKAMLDTLIEQRLVVADRRRDPHLYWRVSHAAPPCAECGWPLVFSSGSAVQRHDRDCVRGADR